MQQQFALHPSRYLAVMLIVAHAAATLALAGADLPPWAKAMLIPLVLFSLGYHLWRDAWLAAPSSPIALRLDGNRATITTRDGTQMSGQILRDSLVTPYLGILNVLPQDARMAHSALILPDSMNADSFRQLRVLLKWGSA